ncbi:MAG TPA: EAL domain-containing protein [Nitriliruptorales bacterium]
MKRPKGIITSAERLTVAWVAALTAIAALTIGGTLLVDATLSRQSFNTRALTIAGHQQARSVQLQEAARALVTAEDQASRDAAIESIRSTLPDFEDNHRTLAFGDADVGLPGERSDQITSILRSMEQPRVQIVAAAIDLLVLEGTPPEDAALDHQRRRAADLVAAEVRYGAGVRDLVATWEDDAVSRVDETRQIVLSILLATMALLLVEAFLVFRPATQRVRDVIVAGRRAQESERARSREQLEMLARFDHLTGLANRALFRDRLERALAQADRSGERVAVMFMDLDKFKDVNDQHGHDAGDDLLVAVAGRIDRCARKTDTVARLGGDEFVVLLENLDTPDGAANVAQKILEQLAMPFSLSGRQVHITTSIGIALYPDDATSLEGLLRAADSAMYEAKSAGRNMFQFSTPELRATNIKRLQVISDLRRSVAKGDLRLAYQPLLSVGSGQITGVEALVRWVTAEGEEVPASAFIGIAEDTDLMLPLGEWVLREACRQGVRWQEEDGLGPLRISINLSERQFRQPDLAKATATILNETGFDPHLLEIEITEDTLVNDMDTASATLRLLKGIGIRIVIDDFGTGYSSLSHLKHFPIDALKIDRSFMQDITGPEQTDESVIPAAIAGLARHLGIEALAEGVETEAHLEFLRRIRVDQAQGWHISPPVEADEIPAIVRRSRITEIGARQHGDAGA